MAGVRNWLAPRGGPTITFDVSAVERAGRSVERQRVAVHARGAGPFDPLATDVVLRPVARALEPTRRVAERDPAAEVGALLRQGVDVAAGVGDEQAAGRDVGRGLGRRRSTTLPRSTVAPVVVRRERTQRLVGGPAGGARRAAVPPSFHPIAGTGGVSMASAVSLELDVPVGPRGDELPAGTPEERADDREHDGDDQQAGEDDDRHLAMSGRRSTGCDRCRAGAPT